MPALDARGQETTVHRQRGASNIAGRWRAKEGDGASDVFGGAAALQRNIGFEVVGHAAHRWSWGTQNVAQVHMARHHGVAADIVGT